jgi:hypothetical protein
MLQVLLDLLIFFFLDFINCCSGLPILHLRGCMNSGQQGGTLGSLGESDEG